MSTAHNVDPQARPSSLSVFDSKTHAPAPKVDIKPPAEHHNTIGDLLRSIQYRSFDATTDGANNVVVDTRLLKAGPARGVKNFLTPPKGPSCIGKA